MTKHKIGFMQGRLSPQIDGKIQAFPWPYWQNEFPLAESIGLSLMEWTLDQERIFENPLMTEAGRAEIKKMSVGHGLQVVSLTGDCFMQAPFWKMQGAEQQELIEIFRKIIFACADIGIRFIVVPLVDNGAIQTPEQQDILIRGLLDLVPLLKEKNIAVVFESDFAPAQVLEFIDLLPKEYFGINFDMGNSASLGWNPGEEIPLLAPRIMNVHVKDRVLGGTTVPLGTGNVDFSRVFSFLRAAQYDGNYILQTARAVDGEHLQTLQRYAAFVSELIGA